MSSKHHLVSRLATGGFILHSGLEKWKADAETAAGVHGFASMAYPFLSKLDAATFAKLLAAGEIVIGTALVVPKVPNRIAGLGLAGLAGGLLGLYVKVPGLRREGSIWPTQAGNPVAKDVWLAGTAADLILDR